MDLGQHANLLNGALCMVLLDQHGIIKDANDMFLQVSKYQLKDVVNASFSTLQPEFEDRPILASPDQLLGQNKQWRGPIRITGKDNAFLWLDVTIVKVNDDVTSEFLVFGLPVSEKTSIQAANVEIAKRLSQSEIRYRTLLETQKDLVVIITPTGTRKYINAEFSRFFGKSKRYFIGTSIFHERLEGLTQEYLDSFSSISLQTPNFTNLHATRDQNDEPQWILWQVNGVFDGYGNLIEVLSVGRNISTIILADLQKNKYLVSLEEMAFKISHIVRSPLTTMKGLINLIDNNAISVQELSTIADSLKSSLEKMDQATKDLSSLINENYSGFERETKD